MILTSPALSDGADLITFHNVPHKNWKRYREEWHCLGNVLEGFCAKKWSHIRSAKLVSDLLNQMTRSEENEYTHEPPSVPDLGIEAGDQQAHTATWHQLYYPPLALSYSCRSQHHFRVVSSSPVLLGLPKVSDVQSWLPYLTMGYLQSQILTKSSPALASYFVHWVSITSSNLEVHF